MVDEEKQLSFATLLVEKSELLDTILQCFRITNNKPSTWKFIQKLPLNQEYLGLVQKHLESGNWPSLFLNKTTEQAVYIVHIIMHSIKTKSSLKEELFK